ncbi:MULTISPECIES: M20 metallopeptidase family protein [Paenibacillus]|jgi:amidohydrolase|uniref:M20 metallopeptidase family protein n=1 Tax=Paenibacillus TaxID=44249 RepID=UPI0005801B0E|nr:MULTISPECIES: M20 family metallopeptidase [Paenibacillus]MCH6188658.1 M20 family metallopeptidase [Paenibacillus polymyxa]UMY54007.1 M20 family metallopeptidase [Paenibacillus peoriae]WRL61543.1 M20 family metallopeptidase [Paenibacillus polymyxa]
MFIVIEEAGDFLSMAHQLQDKLVKHRHHLHAVPELDLSLPRTTAYVKEVLESMGLEPTPVGESGLMVTIGGQHAGKVILIRADMDGLPIQEETELSFASLNGNMHACGHDLHTSMLLGAAEILKANEEQLRGTVKLMFQPGEETLHGAKMMLKNGILDNPKVDASMMLHVLTGMPIPIGQFVVPEAGGVISASSDWFEIIIRGRGAHGAMPSAAVDPLNVAAHLHLALQGILSREIPPVESAVLTIGVMEGGSTNNVIPDTARMKGSVRTFNAALRDKMETRIHDISAGIGETFQAKVDVIYTRGCPEVKTDSGLNRQMRTTIANTFGASSLIGITQLIPGGKLMGSEDFAFVSQAVPSTSVFLNAGNTEEGYGYPVHHPKTMFSDEVLYKGAAAYAAFARDWLESNR